MSAATAIVSGLSGRYALAVFELADESQALDRLDQDLTVLTRMIDDSADLRRLLTSPRVGRDDQVTALRALAGQAGLSDLTSKFLGTLAANRRLSSLEKIIADIRRLLADKRGEVTAKISSAQALNDAQRDRLKEQLKAASGRTIVLEERVDPALIGGLVVQLGSRQIDASLKTKLDRIEQAMKGN